MSPPALHAALEELLERCGALAMERFGRAQVSVKADTTLVTDADQAVEAALVQGLGALFPDDAVVGEEGGGRPGNARTWYVDPIDGTQAFVEGLAHWGPSVAALDDQGLVVGATWYPRIRELYFFERGRGAWLNGRRLPDLDGRPAGRRDVIYVPSRFFRWFDLDHPGKVRGLGCTTAHLALVARGSAIATVVGAGWKPWDVVAGLGMLKELGGAARTLQHAPVDAIESRGQPFVAGHPHAVAAVLDGIALRASNGGT